MGPNKRQQTGEMLIGTGQMSDWSEKSIKELLLIASFSIHYSIIISNI